MCLGLRDLAQLLKLLQIKLGVVGVQAYLVKICSKSSEELNLSLQMLLDEKNVFFFSPFLVVNSLKMRSLALSEPQLWPPRDHERLGRADASSGCCFPLQNPSPAVISGNHNPLNSSELKSAGEFVVVWPWGLFSRAEPTCLGWSVTGGSASCWAAEVQPRGRGSVY